MTYIQSSDNHEASCGTCGRVFFTGDTVHVLRTGKRVCVTCASKNNKRNAAARAIRQAYADCGMVRVRGTLGGIYYE